MMDIGDMVASYDTEYPDGRIVGKSEAKVEDTREVGWAAQAIGELREQVRQLSGMAYTVSGADRLTETNQRISAETTRLNILRQQIGALERRLEKFTETANEAIRKAEEATRRVVNLEEDDPAETIEAMLERARNEALSAAHIRVLEFMEGHWSKASILAVLSCIDGESVRRHSFEGRSASGFCERPGCGKDPKNPVHR